jgi:hypothetical protein
MNVRKLLAGVALASVTSGLSALEWQASSATTSDFANTPSPPTNIQEELFGALKIPLDNKGGDFEMSAHAWVGYPATAAADFDTFNFNLIYQDLGADVKKLKWTLGRYMLTDPTGLIVNQPIDGSVLDFDMGGYNLKLATGYSGLVMRSTTTLVLSKADQESEALLASPRLFGSVETSFVLSGHTLTVAALAQQDQTNPSKLIKEWALAPQPADKGGNVDSQYLTLKAEGPLADKVFYTLFTTFESGTTLSLLTDSSHSQYYQYKPITAFLAGGEANWFLPDFLSATVTVKAMFASGDADATSPIEGNSKGNATLFVPINPTTLGVAFSPTLSNLGYYELSGSLKPLQGETFVVGGKLMGFHRLVSGTVNASGVLSNGPIWLGQELDVFANWQPYSDLQLTATVGAFVPTSGTFASSSSGSGFQYALTTGVNLSL